MFVAIALQPYCCLHASHTWKSQLPHEPATCVAVAAGYSPVMLVAGRVCGGALHSALHLVGLVPAWGMRPLHVLLG